jgi:hypothetical protein
MLLQSLCSKFNHSVSFVNMHIFEAELEVDAFDSDGDGGFSEDEVASSAPPLPRVKLEPVGEEEASDPLKGAAKSGAMCYYCLEKKSTHAASSV